LEFNELLKKRLNGGKFDTEKQRHNLLGNHFSLFLFIYFFFTAKFIDWPDETQTLAIWTDCMCALHNENTLSHTNYLPFALAERGSGYDNFVIFR